MRKSIIITVLGMASIAGAAVPTQNGPFVMYLLSDDISNTTYGSPPEPSNVCTEVGPGNPGNEQCNGAAGENPNGKGGWGTGVRGRGE